MKELDLPPKRQPNQKLEDWLGKVIADINEASRDRPEVSVPQNFTLSNFDPTTDLVTAFDVTGISDADLRKAMATLLYHFQKQGPLR
jgi:Ser/Thr protein kinase RdoA (MazF antagonist)